jgi:hypothetical protein
VIVPRLTRLQVVASESKINVEIRAATLTPDVVKAVDIEANLRPEGTEGAPAALCHPYRYHVGTSDFVLGRHLLDQAAKAVVGSGNRPLILGTASADLHLLDRIERLRLPGFIIPGKDHLFQSWSYVKFHDVSIGRSVSKI